MTLLPRLLTCAALTFALSTLACDSGDDESTETKAEGTSSGDGDGDGDGDATTNAETESGGDDNSGCPLGSFDCPCFDDGTCDAGLECVDGVVCALDGSGGSGMPTTDGPPTTTASPSDPDLYDPEECEAPSKILDVEDIAGQFCSAPCVLEEDCPVSASGADPACTISTVGGEPDHCALLCTPTPDGEQCPEGSTCKAIPQQPNFGLCTYP